MGDADLNNCLSVQESSGQVVINLTRMGNLEQEVGVVCYTESDTAQGDTDYVSRGRGSLESVVMFGVNQSVAECRVQIRDDQEFETGERFLVHLASGGTDNFINTDPNLSSICVYISYAEEDSKEGGREGEGAMMHGSSACLDLHHESHGGTISPKG